MLQRAVRVPEVTPAEHLGLDLLVAIDRTGDRPLREQLEGQLRDGIRRGVLHAATPLPSTRALAAELRVSRGVVVEAYAQLVAEGFLVARPGAATRVASVARHEPAAPPVQRVARPVRFDFRVEAADLSAFPRRAWAGAAATTRARGRPSRSPRTAATRTWPGRPGQRGWVRRRRHRRSAGWVTCWPP